MAGCMQYGMRCRGALAAAVLLWMGAAVARPEPPRPADEDAAYAEYLRETKGVLDIRTVHASPLGADALDLVVVSAGFTAGEMDEFLELCDDLTRAFFSLQPWTRFRDWVNIHAVFIEDESPSVSRVRVSGYEGQVLTCDNGVAMEYAMYAADADGVLVLHNSSFSTPACGMWGVVVLNRRDANNPGSPVHELGHGLAGLGDEYIQRSGAYDGAPDGLRHTVNVTTEPNPRLSKWHYWTEESWPGPLGALTYRSGSPVGNYEGAGWPTGIYRPERSCMMRGDRNAFCAVCDETMQANILRYVNLLSSVEPAEDELVLWRGESIEFYAGAVEPLRSPPAWLASRLDLYLNGRRLSTSERGEVGFRFDGNRAPPGVHQLGARLTVQCDFVRRDFGFLSDHHGWRVRMMPHARPGLNVREQVTIGPGDEVRVPVAIEHSEPGLFALRMEHAPEGAALEDGQFVWRPEGRTGSWRVDFIAAFDDEDAAVASLVIQVDGAGPVTVEPGEVGHVLVGRPERIELQAAAPEGGHLLFEPVEIPAGAALDRYSGVLTWTATTGQAGPQLVRYRVRNGQAVAEGEQWLFVQRPARPTPVSYSNSYRPDTLAHLAALEESPVVYRRLFETLRLLRDRYDYIYEPALAAAEMLFDELEPVYREQVLDELGMQAWSFTDKPAVRDWMRRITADADSDNARRLARHLFRMDAVDQIKQAEMEGEQRHVIPMANALARSSDPFIQTALQRAIKAICERIDNDPGTQRALLSVLAQSQGPGRSVLVRLLPLEQTPELMQGLDALAADPDSEVARAARQALDYFTGLGATHDFITAWWLAGPYIPPEGQSLFHHAFPPEQGGDNEEWQPILLEPENDVYIANLSRLVGGDNRAAYMKTLLHAEQEQEVLFAAGSDDGIKVWLNGELIHAKEVQRAVRPGEDQFLGRLKPGDNVLLCKIVQYTLGWGACMSVHAADGGPALGVSVPVDRIR